MSEIQYHAAQRHAHDLSARLRKVLTGIDHPRASELAARLVVDPHDRPRLVLTGQYSSGKSTVVRALTDGAAEVVIDSAISTDEVTEYDWDGLVVLVDTPGVQAGVVGHDALAEDAIRAADLVLFTTTVDLFDDAAIRHLHHVADTLRKHDQLLIVIAKANTMTAGQGIREDAVRAALGPALDLVPHVECDARDYLDGLTHTDPGRGAAYRQMSNIDALRDAINEISARRGDLARYQQPLQVISAIALEAQGLLADDPEEAAALALLARQRAALTSRKERITASLNEVTSTFTAQSVQAADAFADAVESIETVTDDADREPDLKQFTSDLNDRLDAAADRMISETTRRLDEQFDDLASEVRQIEASPHARLVLDLAHEGHYAAESASVHGPTPTSAATTGAGVPSWARPAAEWLRKFHQTWGAGGGMKPSSGSLGHKVVLKVGHALGKRFKPWQAVRTANRMGKAIKTASVLITIGSDVADVVLQERAEIRLEKERARRRAALVTEVTTQAGEISRRARAQVDACLDLVFSEAYAQIDAVHDEIIATRATRSALATELHEITRTAARALTDLSPST